VERAGDVLDLRFEPREERGLRDGSEVVRVDVTHDEIGATRAHLEAQLAELTPDELVATWSRSEEQP
jgi:hypothetical protein